MFANSIQDKVMLHKAALAKRLLASFSWSAFLHPPFSPDFTPSDFAVFVVLMNALGRKQFQSHVEVETFVKSLLANLVADTYNEELPKLVWQNKCLNRFDNYIEKQLQPPACKCIFFIIFVPVFVFFQRGISYFSDNPHVFNFHIKMGSFFHWFNNSAYGLTLTGGGILSNKAYF